MQKIFLAIDSSNIDTIKEIYLLFKDNSEVYFKIGMQAYYKYHNQIFNIFTDPERVFLDLKLLDIPNTVYSATKEILKYPIGFLTVHSLLGEDTIKAAVKARNERKFENDYKTKILAVTILTSIDSNQFNSLYSNENLGNKINLLSKLSFQNNADGVICSLKESTMIKECTDLKFLTVCPGIRLSKNNNHDQKRSFMPEEISNYHCDYLVAGRAILEDTNNFDKDKIFENYINLKGRINESK